MRKFLVLALLLLVVSGCSAPAILINGAPPANHMLFMKSGDLQIYAQANRHYYKVEGKEKFVATDFVQFEEDLPLTLDTIAVSASIRIVNEKKRNYQVWETFEVRAYGEDVFRHTSNLLYSGSLSLNDLRVQMPIRSIEEGLYRLEVFNDKGELQCFIGTIKYRWVRGARNTQ